MRSKSSRQLQIVGDHDDAQPAGIAQTGERPHEFRAMFQVERGGRLVEQQNARLLRQRARQDDQLPLAPGERGHAAFRQVRRPGRFERFHGDGAVVIAFKTESRCVRCPPAEYDVDCAERKDGRGGLGHVGDLSGAQARLPVLQRDAIEQDFPAVGRRRPASRRISVDLPEPLEPDHGG